MSKPHLRPIFRCLVIIFLITMNVLLNIIFFSCNICYEILYSGLRCESSNIRNPTGLATILVLYSLLILIGLLGNLLLFIMLIRKRLYRCHHHHHHHHCQHHHQQQHHHHFHFHRERALNLRDPIQCCVLSMVIACLLQVNNPTAAKITRSELPKRLYITL